MEPLTDFEVHGDLATTLSFLRATLESTGDGILVVDRAGRIALYNSRFTELWRIPLQILEARDDARTLKFVLSQVVDPAAFLNKVRDLYAAPEASSFDVIRLTGDRTYERYSQPQRLGGAVVGRVWSFRDVSVRTRTEERLRRATAELQAVLDNVMDPVIACDTRYQVFLTNEAARRISGASEGLDLLELKERMKARDAQGRPLAAADLPLARAVRGELVRNFGLLVDAAYGPARMLRVSAAPIRGAQGEVVAAVSVSRDVTEQVELENLKDQFVTMAAHELKTPVAVMKSYAQLALQQSKLPPPLTRMLEGIDRGADRIARIVRSLLDINQLQVGPLAISLERLDLGQLIDEVSRSDAFARAQPRLRLDLPREVIVNGSRSRLIQVTEALIDNALRYSPDGGEVRISLCRLDREVVVEIEDHGIGIARDKQGKIFERFYRAHAGTPHDYGGLGVGLYLSREILRQHGGRLWFRSVEGGGSQFFFALPVAP